MDIFDTALEKEITKIISEPKEYYYWKAVFNIGDQTVEILKVLSIDNICDYQSNFADELLMHISIGAGTYAYRIYPYLDKLEVTLYKVPIGEISESRDELEATQSEKYTATIIAPQSPILGSSTMAQMSEYSMNLNNIIDLKVQLISKPIEQIRMISIGTVFRNVTVGDAIRAILTNYSSNIDVDEDNKPLGVEMVEPANTAKRDHILIPTPTLLIDTPMYIHKYCGGVYSAGMAYYYHQNYWYVFPPYDVTRFDKSKKTLTIIRVPENKLAGIERTYRVDSGNVMILANGNSTVINDSEKKQLNEGNGVRFTSADKIINDPVQVADNKALYSRGSNNNEFITVSRPNGLNNVLASSDKITANPYFEFSKLATRDGAVVAISWENSNPSLIYPGMPVKILYVESDEIKQMMGIVLQAHHYTKTARKGMMTGRHFSTTNLMVYVKQDLDYGSLT